ncbi:MAG: cation:dicarboxylase symporter family transporter, partial [Haliea sp.]
MSLTNRILIGMVAGILLGSLLNVMLGGAALADSYRMVVNDWLVNGILDVIGRIFIASLKLLVVPLVLVSLICGSSALGDSARMGPIALKTIGFYLATTALAITVALLVAVAISPGSGVELAGEADFVAAKAPPLVDVLVGIVPSNPIQAMAEGNMLQIIVFALLFGYAISHAGESGRRIASFFSDTEAVIMK